MKLLLVNINMYDLTFSNILHAELSDIHYYCKFISIDKKFLKKLGEENIKCIIKGSFVAILSSEEFLVVNI